MADIYSTETLARVIEGLHRPQTSLLAIFFPSIITFDTEKVVFDFADSDRMALPYVSPLRQGRVFKELGYQAKEFAPAYLKPKTTLDPVTALRRAMGEQIGGGQLSPEQRRQAALARTLRRHVDGIAYRKEQMAGEVLMTGGLTITGEDYPTSVIDFGRSAGASETLTGALRWGESGVSPLADIEDWMEAYLEDNGTPVTDIVFTVDAFKYLRQDQEFLNVLDTNYRGNMTQAELVAAVQEGAVEVGRLGAGGPTLHVYSGWYKDPEDNTQKRVLAENSVVLGSRVEAAQGSQLHGAIIDDDIAAELGASADQPLVGEFISKSWTERDPGRRLVMTQSAPLVVPGNPNCQWYRKVR